MLAGIVIGALAGLEEESAEYVLSAIVGEGELLVDREVR